MIEPRFDFDDEVIWGSDCERRVAVFEFHAAGYDMVASGAEVDDWIRCKTNGIWCRPHHLRVDGDRMRVVVRYIPRKRDLAQAHEHDQGELMELYLRTVAPRIARIEAFMEEP